MPELIAVDDPLDPRIAAYRDIRERDLVRTGGFIAEGGVVLDQLLASDRFEALSLLLLRARAAGLAERLARVPPGVPVYVADRPVLDAVAGFPMHRGVLAHGRAVERRAEEDDRLLARIAATDGIVVAAITIANHDNLGAIFRNAAAFGAGAVVIDEGCCDPLYRKAIRVSVGAVLTVPTVRAASPAEAASKLDRAGFRCLALSPAGKTDLHTLEIRGPTALFLGAEGEGLPEALMARMETLRIAMAPGLDSLNVATAAAIVLHRLYSAALFSR